MLAPFCAVLFLLRQSPSVPTWTTVSTPSFFLETDVFCCEICVLPDKPWPVYTKSDVARSILLQTRSATRLTSGVTRRPYDGALSICSERRQAVEEYRRNVLQLIGVGITRNMTRCQTISSESIPGRWYRFQTNEYTLEMKYRQRSLDAYEVIC